MRKLTSPQGVTLKTICILISAPGQILERMPVKTDVKEMGCGHWKGLYSLKPLKGITAFQ